MKYLLFQFHKYRYAVFGFTTAVFLFLSGYVFAAVSDRGKVLGSSFSVASSDIKLLVDMSKGTTADNLVDELPGPSFANIVSSWSKDYLMKILNNGTTTVDVAAHARYTTANDPGDLRSVMFVEPIEWNDANTNGVVDTGETGISLGKKTFVKWNTEGFDLGEVASGAIKGLILRFTTDSLSDTKQGKSAVFDFEFDSIGQ